MEFASPHPVVYTDVNVVPEHGREGVELTITTLQEEMLSLRSKQRNLDGMRREALDKILDIKGSIRVFARVKSSLSTNNRKLKSSVSVQEEKVTVRSAGGVRKEFNTDTAFAQGTTQEDVFQEVEPILRSAVDGHNVCIFAYGQTGTGKTFTMEGTDDQLGIVPRAIRQLFHQLSQHKSTSFTLSMSVLEVYMGRLRDLLAHRQHTSRPMQSIPKCGLNILTTNNGSMEVEGLTDVEVADYKQAYRWYGRGKRARSTSWTNVNEASSRSHCLTRITIRRSGDHIKEGNGVATKLWMVDLGGSERLLKTGAIGQTLDEGKAINLSLSALGDVIASLKRKQNHIPYRNSKLTQILSDSLGAGSKVLMIVHISPSEDDISETICSLSFAKRVRAIEPNRELSEDAKKHKERCISELNQHIVEAEEELQVVRNDIERIEKLIQAKEELSPMACRLGDVVHRGEVKETPRTSEKVVSKVRSNLVPRFMNPTVSSRQRQCTTAEVNVRSRQLRLYQRVPMALLGSQSHTYSEPYIKSSCRNSKSKLMTSETNNPSNNTEDSTSSYKKVSTSHPNLRVTMHQHRRRMSDLL